MSNRRKLRPLLPQTFLSRPAGNPATKWNYEPATAVRVRVRVADAPQFAQYWARPHIGTIRQAVRVTYGGCTFYLDNEDGSGWHKVTNGGGPGLPYRDLEIESEVIDQ